MKSNFHFYRCTEMRIVRSRAQNRQLLIMATLTLLTTIFAFSFYCSTQLRICSAEEYEEEYEETPAIQVSYKTATRHRLRKARSDWAVGMGFYSAQDMEDRVDYVSDGEDLAVGCLFDGHSGKMLKHDIVAFDTRIDQTLNGKQGGSTFVCTIVYRNIELITANVGDSRAVLYYANGYSQDITTDHKPNVPKERRRIERNGCFVKRNRVNGGLAMSRSMGDFHYKWPEECITAEPDVFIHDLDRSPNRRPKFVILASDGVWDKLKSEEAAGVALATLDNYPDEGEKIWRRAAKEIVEAALDKGSKDNVSAMVIDLDDIQRS